MIDGRSVYTPLFGGVFWDVQNVLLEDIDRIEVISGPGGTLWGANAVNGVINVVTKSAKETQGLYLSGAAGSFMQDFGGLRYGGTLGTNLYYRVYAQRYDFNGTELATGASALDDWDMSQGGFRMDWDPTDENTFTLQGDIYSGSEGVPTGVKMDGQNILGRWKRTFSEESELIVQLYYDRTWRRVVITPGHDEMETYDVDFQHRLPIGERQSLIWGFGYRLQENYFAPAPGLALLPPGRSMQLFSGFIQDEILLHPEKWRLTIGSKLEHNDFSGFEIQPNVRLAWLPAERHTVWGGVSRAVRSPTRLDADLLAPTLAGSSSLDSEKVMIYELGYRVGIGARASMSLATYYNDYDELRSINANPLAPPALIFRNDQEAQTWGVELSGSFQATDWWRLRGGYTFMREEIEPTSPTVNPISRTFEAIDPRHQFVLQSIMDLPANFQFDTVVRYVDHLEASVPGLSVPEYITCDVRLAWQYKKVELSLVGMNLVEARHREFGSQYIPRGVYGKMTWRF